MPFPSSVTFNYSNDIHVTANDVIKGLSMSTDEEVCNGLAAWSDPGRE